jgi:SNF2 family DNA or RNA helicase
MERAVEHLMTHKVGGLALDPGLRKTSITLKAYIELNRQSPRPLRMLVIAPLRVCRTVWRQEGAKWSQFRHLRFSLLHGSKKDQRLADDADVYLINPEGIAWLCRKFFGCQLPFDIVTIDELTKFKAHDSERSKALRPRIERVQWKWGLTGSLAPNGYMDLFGQQLVLDGGAALGRYITHFRDQYFQLDYDGFTYKLLPGAERRIIQRIAPYWLQMSADDYLQLPPLVEDIRTIELDKAARATYERMKREMIAELPEGVVTAANAAAAYSKLSQMANGAVYVTPDKKTVGDIHDAKLDALEELVEELDGQPLLVAYEFNHDLQRIRERFGADVPFLGNGTSAKDEERWIAAWNRNELPLLLCHPASAGHGLNLQEGNAAHVAWFSVTWDLELYEQFIRRIRRSGNIAQRIFNHILSVTGTIDELKLEALRAKDTTQTRLLKALNAEILREGAETRAGRDQPADDRRLPMVTRLSRQAEPAAAAAHPQQQQEGRVIPVGWGKPDGAEPATVREQREAIQGQIRQPTPAEHAPIAAARSAFTSGVTQQMEAIQQGDYGSAATPAAAQAEATTPAPARKTRRATTEPATLAQPAMGALGSVLLARAKVLQIVFADPATTLEEGLETANDLWTWITDMPA